MTFKIEKYHFKTDSVLEGLPAKEFRLLKTDMQRMEIKKGKTIYREESYSKGAYILRKGKVKIYQTNGDGKEQIAYIYRKGEIMGYRPLLCQYSSLLSSLTDIFAYGNFYCQHFYNWVHCYNIRTFD